MNLSEYEYQWVGTHCCECGDSIGAKDIDGGRCLTCGAMIIDSAGAAAEDLWAEWVANRSENYTDEEWAEYWENWKKQCDAP